LLAPRASSSATVVPGQWGAFRSNTPFKVSVYMLTQPLSHELSDLPRAYLARLNDITTPRRLDCSDLNPTIPTHLRPRILGNDLRPMPVVNDMVAHPVRERHMVTDEAQIVSSFQNTGRLRLFSCVEEANDKTIQMLRRRSRPDLSGRNRIAAQQKVLSLTPGLESTQHRSLHHSMSPFNLPFRSAPKHPQLGYFQVVSELRLDQLADGGLAYPASTCDEKKHVSSLEFWIGPIPPQISDPEPLTLDCQPACHRRVRRIWLDRPCAHLKYQ